MQYAHDLIHNEAIQYSCHVLAVLQLLNISKHLIHIQQTVIAEIRDQFET